MYDYSLGVEVIRKNVRSFMKCAYGWIVKLASYYVCIYNE